jgi:8-oxo-dGTP pyrophosphatase MutT (NUDIX family)
MLPIEQCYGVIVVLKEEQCKFLILEREEKKNDWTFAKGHAEEGETPKETALRELEEETGIENIEILDLPLIHEEYEIIRHGEKRLKINDYFVGFVIDKDVKIEKAEIQSYRWTTFKEALNTFNHERRKQVLKEAQKYLQNEPGK